MYKQHLYILKTKQNLYITNNLLKKKRTIYTTIYKQNTTTTAITQRLRTFLGQSGQRGRDPLWFWPA